jgi:L,D-transpeptidase-like protein
MGIWAMPLPVSREQSRLLYWAFGMALGMCHPAFAATWDTERFDSPPVHRLNTSFGIAPPSDGGLTLSPTEQQVSLIANRNGDRDFLMVDKNRGKIILFGNGRPIYSRPALTGESMADRIPADAWSTPWSQQKSVKFKVTPAGRFTITRNHDSTLGELFDINELQGQDWTIAIHRVWLGKPAERRDARLRSETIDDKHITNGCIDVDPSTMAQLARILPGRGMPLYILPNNESLIGDLFRPEVRRNGPRS